MRREVEVKNMVDELVERLRQSLDVDAFAFVVHDLIKRRYNRGLEEVDTVLHPPTNVLPNEAAIDFLSKYTFDNIKDMNEDMISRLRKELSQGLMNREGAAQIKTRIAEALNVSKARAATIARTESHRAYNFGKIDGAKQSGLKLMKKWSNPDPQADVCKALAGKIVGVDEKFRWRGEEFYAPPAHPNCRSTLVFEQEEA